MESPKITYKYYSNPAFCAQSEVVFTQQSPCVSPRVTTSPKGKYPPPESRIPPLGSNSPRKPRLLENQRVKTDISDNPLRRIQLTKTDATRYVNGKNILELPPKPGPKPSRYSNANPPVKKTKPQIIRRDSKANIEDCKQNNSRLTEESFEMYPTSNGEISDADGEDVVHSKRRRLLKHRYAEIPDDYDDYSPSKKRIIETEPEEYNVDTPSVDEPMDNNVPMEIIKNVNGKIHRYAIIPSDDDEDTVIITKPNSPPTFNLTSPGMPRKQLEATQKLHELLATPKKQVFVTCSPLKSCASSPSINKQFSTPRRIASSTPKHSITPSKSCANLTSPPLPRRNASHTSPLSPKAQQKLIYEASFDGNATVRKPIPDFFVRELSFTKSREPSFIRSRDNERSFELERSREFETGRSHKKQIVSHRSTAVISPRMASRGGSSIYSSGTVFSGKGHVYSPGCASLALAAAMLALCGGLTASLSFYIMYTFGSYYYLDIGVMSGFTCLILGLLGFRSRTYQLLPNRNYVSGYIVVSVFSLLCCVALLCLLVWGRPSTLEGSVLSEADTTGRGSTVRQLLGGAVSTLGSICLLLAALGALSSCCCSRTPPDNRVQHV